MRNEEEYQRKKAELMEKCFACYAEHGLSGTGIKALAKACDCSTATLYTYFENLDDLIIQSTEYCMSKVEDDFMARAPRSAAELDSYIDKTPYWTAKKHGKKYRLMYQVYTHPKYREYGRIFFEGVDKRYAEYAEELSGALGIPADTLRGLIFIFIRACVHYALFEDEFYLTSQLNVLKKGIALFTSTQPGNAE
ncbi:MAG: TetR/AcrR family transcriptional regulator [Coriobacteriales bacterium]